jgi:hypothetical protein
MKAPASGRGFFVARRRRGLIALTLPFNSMAVLSRSSQEEAISNFAFNFGRTFCGCGAI